MYNSCQNFCYKLTLFQAISLLESPVTNMSSETPSVTVTHPSSQPLENAHSTPVVSLPSEMSPVAMTSVAKYLDVNMSCPILQISPAPSGDQLPPMRLLSDLPSATLTPMSSHDNPVSFAMDSSQNPEIPLETAFRGSSTPYYSNLQVIILFFSSTIFLHLSEFYASSC